jgi:hypothetical protein
LITAVPDAFSLPEVSDCALVFHNKESVALAILAWAKRRIMNNSISDKELDELLEAARAAGRAEGYAQAKFEMARQRAKIAVGQIQPEQPAVISDVPASKIEKLEELKATAQKAEEEEGYKTRTTVTMTKTIALDYLKSVAPRIVGPSEIKKNSEKSLNIFISYGTLKRAMDQLVESGDVDQMESSRWRYKGRGTDAGTLLRSVR